MPTIIRELGEADAVGTLSLVNLDTPEPATLDQIRERLRRPRENTPVIRLGAFDDGRMIGYAHALRDPWMPSGLFWAHVVVAPNARGRAVGARLYQVALEFARRHGATTIRGAVRDDFPISLAFTERLGFRVDRHIFESTLDLATFDERPFVAAVEAAGSRGIRFFSLAEVGDGPETRQRLYDLDRTVAADIPGGSEAAIRPFEVFVRKVIESPGYLADGQLVAADGDAWVGLAAVERIPNANNAMYNGLTGVLPAYRGRGVARALKLLAIRAARRHGAAYLRTNNDSENAPMLAINRKLGYHAEPGYFRMIADLSPRSAMGRSN
jgi:GNAT superfamily N-acetyltransferase